MSCNLLKGAPVAAALDEESKAAAIKLKENNIFPCLAIVRIGERADDISYERSAAKRCSKVGVLVKSVVLPESVSQDDLIAKIKALNADSSVHCVLIMLPLPEYIDENAVCAALDPRKDVDGITISSMAKIYSGRGYGYSPCTAEACMELLKYYGIEISGRRIAVIGRSHVIGRPVAMLMTAADGTVTVCHTKTENMPAIVREADIAVVATGHGESIGREHFRAGQTVIDVGTNWSEERQALVGDVKFDEVSDIVSAISPVPGGVGSVTTSVLVAHVIKAAGADLSC